MSENQISKHIKAHLEVSIALSYSPQRGESCSPVFRQRFGIGYAHANPTPQETTPFAIVREKQHKPLMFQSISKDYNMYLYTYTLTFAAVLNTTFLGIYSLNIKDKQLNGNPFEEKCGRLVLMKELTEVHRRAVVKDPLVLLLENSVSSQKGLISKLPMNFRSLKMN